MSEPDREGRGPTLLLVGSGVALVLGIGLFAFVVSQGNYETAISAEATLPLLLDAITSAPDPATAVPDAGGSTTSDAARSTAAGASAPGDPLGSAASDAGAPPPSPAADAGAAGAASPAPDAAATAGDRDAGLAAGEVLDEDDDRRGFTKVYAPDREGIQAAVGEARPLIRDCYAAWIKAHPELAGKITVRFTIAEPPAGSAEDDADEARVTRVALVDSTVDNGLLEGCVLNVMGSLRFERPDGGTLTVSYPFVFKTEE